MTTSRPQSPSFNLPDSFTPDSVDVLPVLSALLSRLQPQSQSSTSVSPPASNPPSADSPLTLKDIPTATDELKHKLQKARVQVKAFPDMDRGLEEQQEEIRELEAKIRKQREVLESLRNEGVRIREERQRKEGDPMVED